MIRSKADKQAIKRLKAMDSQGNPLLLTFKKHENQNEYLHYGNHWIRNFSGVNINPADINNFFKNEDVRILADNEIRNSNHRYPVLEPDLFNRFQDILIIGDGIGFEDHKLINYIRPNVCCFVVNQAARLWESQVQPEFMLVNNPFETVMNSMPVRNFPKLIANRKTHYQFIRSYRNIIYLYDSVPDSNYESSISKNTDLHFDDYRNPICAIISLANKYLKGNVYLAFCSSGFKQNRDATVQIEEGIYQYPVQITADQIIDGNLFWYNFSNRSSKIYHTGVKNSYKFSKYLTLDDFIGNLT